MNQQIYEEASDWMVELRNGALTADARKSFDAWLRQSPHHLQAYLEMSAIWEDVPALNPSWNPSADELIARGRADGNVVALAAAFPATAGESASSVKQIGGSAALSTTRGSETSVAGSGSGALVSRQIAGSARGRMRFAYALAAGICILLAGSGLYLQRGVYVTDTGEQRSLMLADGSTAEINSRTRIKIRYSIQERRIDLIEGQALFRVAKNASRPFVVQSGATQIRAIGTAFDVYKRKQDTVVSVVEGRVAVRSKARPESDANNSASARGASANDVATRTDASAASNGSKPATEILLDAGEQLVVRSATAQPAKRIDVSSATAWTRRSLVFDSSTLVEVAQEFNRYNSRQLVIENPQLADFHISGVFSSVEPALLLDFLRAQPELTVRETPTQIRIDRK